MNIQQFKYVVAVANNGSFREAAKKLYISQPSLSYAVKELEEELNIQLFQRTNKGTLLTEHGREFYNYAQKILREVELVEQRYAGTKQEKVFSVASQHYDFLAPVVSELVLKYPDYRNFRVYESTTLNVIKDVSDYRSELGIIFLNDSNHIALSHFFVEEQLEVESITNFSTHIFVRQGHPLTKKTQVELQELLAYPQVRFTQEANNYTYFAEDLIDIPDMEQTVISTSDRAMMTGILKNTDAYGSGSGLLEDPASQGLALVPLANAPLSRIVAVKKNSTPLSLMSREFLQLLKTYFAENDFSTGDKGKLLPR